MNYVSQIIEEYKKAKGCFKNLTIEEFCSMLCNKYALNYDITTGVNEANECYNILTKAKRKHLI